MNRTICGSVKDRPESMDRLQNRGTRCNVRYDFRILGFAAAMWFLAVTATLGGEQPRVKVSKQCTSDEGRHGLRNAGQETLRPDNPDTIRFGYYTRDIPGGLHAVQGEKWTFDHGDMDPLEGWWVSDLSDNIYSLFGPAFRKVTPESWAGHGNQVACPSISPAGTAWVGQFADQAAEHCYADGLGYGNLWRQRYTSGMFDITGTDELSIRFDCFADLEEAYDSVRLILVFPDGSELPVEEPIQGVLGDPGTQNWVTMSRVVTAEELGPRTQCQLCFELASDVTYSDEDGMHPTEYGPFGFANLEVWRDGAILLQGFERTLLKVEINQSIDGGVTGAQMGQSVCMLDVNSDGFDDVVVGEPGYSNGQSREGRVLCYLGGVYGLDYFPSWSYESNVANAQFGWSIAGGVMDNSNPFPIIIIGAPTYSNGQPSEGRIYVFGTTPGSGLDATPIAMYESNIGGAELGLAVACGGAPAWGDFYFFAGAPFYTNGQTNEGRLYGWSPFDIVFGPPTWTRESNQAYCYLGSDMQVVADAVNGDYLALGLPNWDDTPGSDCGAVEIRDLQTGIVAQRLLGNQPGSQVGLSIAPIADFNGDGGTDLAVMANVYYAGTRTLLMCAANGTAGALSVAEFEASAEFSWPIAPFGRLDPDATGDIVMGGLEPYVRLLDLDVYNPYNNPSYPWTVRLPEMLDGPISLVGDGDVNGDGRNDLLIGSPGYSGGGLASQGRFELRVSGDVSHNWTASHGSPIGDQAGVANVGAYDLPGGACGMQRNVLEVHDANLSHPEGQHTLFESPIVDLTTISADHDIHRAQWDMYFDQPLETGVAYRCGWSYYPWTCPVTGQVDWSPHQTICSPWYFGEVGCWSSSFTAGENMIPPIPGDAERIRLWIEVYSSCSQFGVPPWECIGNPNFSPLFDNIVMEEINGGSIAGKVQRDFDCQGSSPGVPNVVLTLSPGGQVARTDGEGTFAFYNLIPGQYTVTMTPPRHWTTLCGPSVVNYSGTPIRDLRYSVTPNQGVTDVAVAVDGGQAKPGFSTFYGVVCSNLGVDPVAAPLTLNLPSSVTYTESSPPGTYQASDHTVRWANALVGGLQASEYTVLGVVSAQAHLGDNLITTVTYGPPPGDAYLQDNTATCTQTVVGAIDPNDKHVSPQGAIPTTQTLTYHVNFQNVGTAEATNIRIEDPIDTDLDLATLAFGASSHLPTNAYVSGQTAVWEFSGINLPDSTSDQTGSHGFVSFQARPKSGLPSGQEITNYAQIYFDYAEPVRTNTVTNTIMGAAEVEGTASSPAHFRIGSIGPIPARGSVQIRLEVPATGGLSARIYDSTGRLVRTLARREVPSGNATLVWDRRNDQDREVGAGVYFLRCEWSGPATRTVGDARVVLVE